MPKDVKALFFDCTENDWNWSGSAMGLADPKIATKWQTSVLELLSAAAKVYPGLYAYLVINATVANDRRPTLRTLLTDTATQAQGMGVQRAALLEFALDPNGELGCAWHPNAEAHRAMGEQAAAALKADLGW